MAELKPAPSAPSPKADKASGSPVAGSFASRITTGLDGLILSTVLSSQQQPGSSSSNKEPLSLQTTSSNFRKFVQKSGPIFAAQDAVEAVLRWDNAPQTVFFCVAWAFLCLYPVLFFILPNIVLATVLLTTHAARPQKSPSSPDSPTFDSSFKASSFSALPPAEGSVDYLANLTSIQRMMGTISDLSDVGRSFVPYLTWRDERISLVILQITVLSGLAFAVLLPIIPWRFVFLFLGECGLFAGHPIVRSLAREASPLFVARGRKLFVRAARLLDDDALGDEDLDSEIVDVHRFDSESKQDGQWNADLVVGGELPVGWRWIQGRDWQVDVLGDWADGNVDAAGWAYLHIDGTRSRLAVTPTGQATSRRRRLTRRAVRI